MHKDVLVVDHGLEFGLIEHMCHHYVRAAIMLLIGHDLHCSQNDLRIGFIIDPCEWCDGGSIAIG